VRYRRRREPTIRDVSFTVPDGGLLAVVGPSGSGKSTLCTAILGEIRQVEGRVVLGGIDLVRAGPLARRMVSFVPQDEALHDELTPWQALNLTAALRLAPAAGALERARRLTEVIDLLEIQDFATTRIGQLSGGQRKRVAVAMELLSEPRLLMLDEPTAGLDEGLDRVMMQLLRRVADAGCTVLVVTHSSANLTLADSVLALDRAGHVAYRGPAEDMLPTLGADSHAEAMQALFVPPDDPPRRLTVVEPPRAAAGTRPAGRSARRPVPVPDRLDLGIRHSTWVLLRREVRRMAGTPLHLGRGVFLLPVLTCVLAAWAGDRGLAGHPQAPNPMQGSALSTLVVCTAFFAMALSFATVVGDRAVIDRERRWGVPPASVILSKALALTPLTVVQSVLGLLLYLTVRAGPDRALGTAPAALVLAAILALLGVSSMCLGLLISTVSPSLERAVFALMASTAVLVMLSGLFIALGQPSGTGGRTLALLSQLTPTRWGAAALAAYIGFVPTEVVRAGAHLPADRLWLHNTDAVVTALSALAVMTLVYGLLAAQLLARQSRRGR
jgi:ABC transport system ATP-binding/permease protein